jgi:hypothetical protein
MCLNPNQENMDRKRATLVLEDGTTFNGFSFGVETSIGGEIGKSKLIYNIYNIFISEFTIPHILQVYIILHIFKQYCVRKMFSTTNF